ncbi:hypothetical protein ACIO3O_38150 [Streptomyces sp. NPDC087440]|uniref:hypothetical protein n=1 Tax=Streptomyces sp. NPDC087440 TaxID=3365790 RepID=UPI003817ED3A
MPQNSKGSREATPAEDATRIAAQLADELHLSLLARGFYLPMRAGVPVGGRAYVDIDPVRADAAAAMIDAFGPPPAVAAPHGVDPLRDAEESVRSLRRALDAAALGLRALGVRRPGEPDGPVLVDLGVVPPAAARRLATVLARGASR